MSDTRQPCTHAWQIPTELLGASHPEWLDVHIARGDVWSRVLPRSVSARCFGSTEPTTLFDGNWLVQDLKGSLHGASDEYYRAHWRLQEPDVETRETRLETMVSEESLTLTDDHVVVLRACADAGATSLAVCERLTPGSAKADDATFARAALRASAALSQLGRWGFIRLREPFSRVRVTTESGAAALAAHESSGR